MIGREIKELNRCINPTGQQTLQPYSDVSLRVLMRMADILMGKLICCPLDFSKIQDGDTGSISQKLEDHYKKLYKHRKKLEEMFWVDKTKSYFE